MNKTTDAIYKFYQKDKHEPDYPAPPTRYASTFLAS
jgi:hypothetical protein